MRIQELLEGQPWAGFKGSLSSRVWFNSKTGEAITANDDGNHSVAVSNNPQLFGLSPESLAQFGLQYGEKAHDYDGRVLLPAMQNGWVRLYVDHRQPDLSSNAEGISLSMLRRAFIWYCEQVGTPMRFVLILRQGAGDKDGVAHPLKDADAIEYFIRKGSLPRDRFDDRQPAQVKQMDVTPHKFRKI